MAVNEKLVFDIVKASMFTPNEDAIDVDTDTTQQKKVAQVTITNRFTHIAINDPQANGLDDGLDVHGWEPGSFGVDEVGNLTFSVWEQNR